MPRSVDRSLKPFTNDPRHYNAPTAPQLSNFSSVERPFYRVIRIRRLIVTLPAVPQFTDMVEGWIQLFLASLATRAYPGFE
jgi:hypothetical protein